MSKGWRHSQGTAPGKAGPLINNAVTSFKQQYFWPQDQTLQPAHTPVITPLLAA